MDLSLNETKKLKQISKVLQSFKEDKTTIIFKSASMIMDNSLKGSTTKKFTIQLNFFAPYVIQDQQIFNKQFIIFDLKQLIEIFKSAITRKATVELSFVLSEDPNLATLKVKALFPLMTMNQSFKIFGSNSALPSQISEANLMDYVNEDEFEICENLIEIQRKDAKQFLNYLNNGRLSTGHWLIPLESDFFVLKYKDDLSNCNAKMTFRLENVVFLNKNSSLVKFPYGFFVGREKIQAANALANCFGNSEMDGVVLSVKIGQEMKNDKKRVIIFRLNLENIEYKFTFCPIFLEEFNVNQIIKSTDLAKKRVKRRSNFKRDVPFTDDTLMNITEPNTQMFKSSLKPTQNYNLDLGIIGSSRISRRISMQYEKSQKKPKLLKETSNSEMVESARMRLSQLDLKRLDELRKERAEIEMREREKREEEEFEAQLKYMRENLGKSLSDQDDEASVDSLGDDGEDW